MITKKAKHQQNTILRVSAYLFRYKGLFWLTIGLATSMAAMEIAEAMAGIKRQVCGADTSLAPLNNALETGATITSMRIPIIPWALHRAMRLWVCLLPRPS